MQYVDGTDECGDIQTKAMGPGGRARGHTHAPEQQITLSWAPS